MIHHGVGGVQALPARPARAQAEVGVFAVEEEGSVESSDFVEHGPAVKRGRAAGKKGLFGDRKIAGRATLAAL